MLLFLDSRVLNEIPPLRAMWAPIGQQAKVPIVAARDTRVLTGVLNVKSGDWLDHVSHRYRQEDFQTMLHLIRSHWRGWLIVLFLDRHSAHRAKQSGALACALRIELRWLPTACPELNVVDRLWRHVTQDVLANEPTPQLDPTVRRARAYVHALSPRDRLRKAGVLSDSFWLANTIS